MKTPIKTLLMIRAYDQAVDFIGELSVPAPVVFAPMVRIDPIELSTPLPSADIIVFTSSNAVRLYVKLTENRNAKVLCVGLTTVRAAKERGFKDVHIFETAKELVGFFQANIEAKTSVLYPRAETVSFDIASKLSNAGYPVREAVLYSQTFQPLSNEGVDLIESSAAIVPVFSREIAIRFREFLVSAKPHDLIIVSISAPVAAIFDDLNGFHVEIAEKPTRAALFKQIKTSLFA